MRTCRLLTILSTLWMAFLPAASHALSTDKDQPIQLEADSVEIDEAKGVSFYQGNVQVTQGSLKVWADRMWIHRNPKGIDKIITEGNPTRFRQLMDNSPEEVRGKAKKVELFLEKDELHLSQDARIEQGKDSFISDRIIFLRGKSQVKAGSSAQGKERVKVIIEPTKTEP